MSTQRLRSEGLSDGLYEDVVTAALDRRLTQLPSQVVVGKVDLSPEDSIEPLTDIVAQALRVALEQIGGEGSVTKRLCLANAVLSLLRDHAPDLFRDGEAELRPQMLLHLASPTALGTPGRVPSRPETPLTRSELFVNAERQSIVQELLSEIDSADSIELVCSFIKWSGFVKFREALEAHCRRNRTLRVLTTTYLGATHARAIEELQALGAEVKVSYEETPTRLHAKAWMFRRKTGLTTAYIGSSNLSRAALTDGIEWNVRIAGAELPNVIERFEGVFGRYWDDPASGFVAFAGTAEDRERLRSALERARRSGRTDGDTSGYRVLDVEPRDFQRQILEDLDVARRTHGRFRNLVVAATGTGKTVVAALDYRRLRATGHETLLFIAHRDRILAQSRETFASALKDPRFGEMYVGGERPVEGRHVFASIQSLASAMKRKLPAADAFDVIVVDEVHHAAADTYATLLRHFRPKVLLGLTATPERSDDAPGGRLQLDEFFDRPWASELRVWDAIDRQILVPFNYFALDDGTDLRQVRWARGRYAPSELSNVYDAHRIWVNKVAHAVRRYVRDAGAMRAVAFCADIRHARLAAHELEHVLGIRCVAVTSEATPEQREEILAAFERDVSDRPRVLCVVDLLNEGVDLPRIDTLLLLRPTESATLFLQQLGRGLRRAEHKDCLTVLDFVGIQHDKFRFDVRYEALTGLRRGELRDALQHGFGRLPAGCVVQLEEKLRDRVLASVRDALRLDVKALAGRLGADDDALGLGQFLEREGLASVEVYRKHGTWTNLRERAGFRVLPALDETERDALGNVQRLQHVDDPWRLDCLLGALAVASAPATTERERRLACMLFVALYGLEVGSDLDRANRLWASHARLRAELAEVLSVLRARSRVVPRDRSSHVPVDVPLHLHGRYLTEEVMAAFDLRSKRGQVYLPQMGVVPIRDQDILLTTLDKASKSKVPHLQYNDYAMGPRLFHWQSQAGTTRDSKAGGRHLDSAIVPLLFVREVDKDERGLGVAYRFLGAVERVDARGERPMSITYRLLDADMPADLLLVSRAAVA